MKNQRINLQFFADGAGGGSGAGAGTGTGAGAGSGNGGTEGTGVGADNSAGGADQNKGRKGNSKRNALADVVYGKEAPGGFDTSITYPSEKTPDTIVNTKQSEDKKTAFDNLIRGDYKEEFNSKVHGIIEDRLQKYKGMESQMETISPILDMLSEKYGVDAKDLNALSKAVQEDESYYEREAMERGLEVSTLKELKKLERENASLKEAQAKAEQKENGKQIYAKWMQQAEDLKAKYGLADFDFGTEIQNNPQFLDLLGNPNIDVETAYLVTHKDQIISGSMAYAANTVKQNLVNSLSANASRPSENGMSSNATATFKRDPSKWTKEDRREVARRAQRGEKIYL